MNGTLLSLGHGYSARALTPRLLAEGWHVIGTTRDPAKAERLRAEGVEPVLWGREALLEVLPEATHLLVSAGPDADGDPSLSLIGPEIARHARSIHWAGYLSTTGVYGDHRGAWVDETTPLSPSSERGAARVAAEAAWGAIPHLPLHVFRLAGIYGPGRGPFQKIRKGTARRLIKPGQVFSRIHVEDIAQALWASIHAPDPGAVYNLCDDVPAPPQDVLSYAAELLGHPLPPRVDFETAELSEMVRSFYSDNKRVSNARVKKDLNLTLLYPDYQSGLQAILRAEGA
ncbi:SDR family oxidoreductase [Pseudoponticoccus marisrubri]|uniref:NAD(P)-dependent oxidoreductase n=1 Tax=Pseudoponticoccus marisrubri TaxID=1685382 RepID=A0A0W7WQ37_9RHOB|nr:SDR family oxidoreductase [Pseudoponticoccus marisrubri]KUF12685.1 NAD(P)-dependent oxidoreductase [Pseudoponticoccus marisrubri]